MRLLLDLFVRIAAVVALCLVVTAGWILVGTHRDIGAATQASADRALVELQALYWQKLVWRDGLNRAEILPQPEWQTLATARIVAPGICIGFSPDAAPPQRLCSEAEGVYPPAPAWFGALYAGLFGPFVEVRRSLDLRQHLGEVTAAPDPETALRLAWLRIGLMVDAAALMALAIGLLVALAVTHALMPVRTIIAGLERLAGGDYGHRIEGRPRSDLGRIAAAVDDLAARLAVTSAARDALTRQLLQVQEDERRALARDLHDEFGQCLAATSALAGSIEAGAGDRPDLADDARAIGAATARMMATLKEALVRLRSQDIDDLGLEACLRGMTSRWAGRAEVELVIAGDLASVPRPVAIGLYRIAQECLTNAARHGATRHIRLAVESTPADRIALSVEDDGGGDPERIGTGVGHGLIGIRERIAALGGRLDIGRAARGIRVAATIPMLLPGPVPAGS